MAKESAQKQLENFISKEVSFNELNQSQFVKGLDPEVRKQINTDLSAAWAERAAEEKAYKASKGKPAKIEVYNDKNGKGHFANGQSFIDKNGNISVHVQNGALETAKLLSEHLMAGNNPSDFKILDDKGNEKPIPSVSKLLAYNANAIATLENDKRSVENVGDLSDLKAVPKGNQTQAQATIRIGLDPKVILDNAKQTKSAAAVLDTLKEVAENTRRVGAKQEAGRANAKLAEKSKDAGQER